MGNTSRCYRASPAIRDHTQANTPCLNPARQAGTQFICPKGMEGWVDLGVGDIPIWFTCLQMVTYPSTNHSIAPPLGVEPTALNLKSAILQLRHQEGGELHMQNSATRNLDGQLGSFVI